MELRGSGELFDASFSISSFEHDGLGRYGDPIAPDGDLAAMAAVRSLLKDDGFLFLAVPCGRDAVVWNAQRIYGKARLPLLLGGGWDIVSVHGFEDVHYEFKYFPSLTFGVALTFCSAARVCPPQVKRRAGKKQSGGGAFLGLTVLILSRLMGATFRK